jgi:hypothetical protein
MFGGLIERFEVRVVEPNTSSPKTAASAARATGSSRSSVYDQYEARVLAGTCRPSPGELPALSLDGQSQADPHRRSRIRSGAEGC